MRRKLLILTKSDSKGASTRYRAHQYLPHLKDAGFEAKVVPPAPPGRGILRPIHRMKEESRLLRQAGEADVILIQKRLVSARLVMNLAKLGKPVVFDFDDAIFTSPKGDWSSLTRSRVRKRLTAILQASCLVLAGNRYLAEFAGRWARRVEVLPTAIDLTRYRLKAVFGAAELTLGWMGSQVNHRYLDLLQSPLSALVREMPQVSLTVVSDKDYSLPGLRVKNLRWSEATEIEDLLSFDIGLMPLEDTEWTRGKCGLKALQYMAAGLPAVCSAVGVNGEIIEDKQDGFLCRSDADWKSALSQLASDPALRAEVGRRGRAKVEQRYSVDRIGKRLVDLLSSL